MSNPLVEALKEKFKVFIKYFTQAVHIGIEAKSFRMPLILCVCKHSIAFIDCEFNSLLGEVFFAHLQKVIEQEDYSGDILRFEFSDNRSTGMPKKMTLILTEKLTFLKHLKCSWETDYMWRLSKVKQLRIYQEKFDMRQYKKEILFYTDKDIYLMPPNYAYKTDYKGYAFFVENCLKESEVPSEFSGEEENQKYVLNVKIMEVQLVEKMHSDLRTSAENYAEKIVQEGNEYAYFVNNPYIKKSNLVMDISKWEGWEVGLLTTSGVISVIFLRRKFIPPLMDSGQDFIIQCVGGENSKHFCSETADSIYTLGMSNETYKPVLEKKCEALIMNDETIEYYQKKFKIEPSKIFYAYQLLACLLTIIEKQLNESKLKKLLEDIRKVPKSKSPIQNAEKIDDPTGILEEFFRSCLLEPGSRGYKIWCKKVCRYLAYCLDGGLMQNRISLKDILTYLMKLKFENKEVFGAKIVITRLLNVNDEENNEEFDDLHTAILKVLETSGFTYDELFGTTKKLSPRVYEATKSWVFNQNVMIALIETGYLRKELETNNLGNLYSKLFVYILQHKSCSLKLKLEICKISTNIQEQDDIGILKILLPHLFDIYVSKNYTMATEAAISLVNLTYNNRENKQFLFSCREGIINRLSCKDNKLICLSILLLINLSSDQARKKVISKECRDALIKIIVGSKVVKQNDEVISKCFQILAIFAKDHSNAEHFCSDGELILSCISFIGKNDDHSIRAVSFLEVLVERYPNSKSPIGKKAIRILIDYLKKAQSLEVIKRVLNLFRLLALSKSDGNYQILISHNVGKVLEGLLQNSVLTMDHGIVGQINALKEFLGLL